MGEIWGGSYVCDWGGAMGVLRCPMDIVGGRGRVLGGGIWVSHMGGLIDVIGGYGRGRAMCD